MRYYQVVVRGGFYGQLRGDTRRLKGERTVETIDLVCTSWDANRKRLHGTLLRGTVTNSDEIAWQVLSKKYCIAKLYSDEDMMHERMHFGKCYKKFSTRNMRSFSSYFSLTDNTLISLIDHTQILTEIIRLQYIFTSLIYG